MTETARAWETVLQHVEGLLAAGTLVPGDHLPAERALASELGVGRSSVREALRVLEVMGLIRTQTGSGPQSGAVIVARPSGGLAVLLRLQVAASGFAVPEVVRTRVALEQAVVAELAEAVQRGAAGRARPPGDPDPLSGQRPELDEAAELLDAMDAPGLPREEFLALDQAFHLALAAASGNQVTTAVMGGLRDSIEGYVRAGAAALPDWDATCARLRAEHRAVIGAVEAGDATGAAALIRAHIEDYHAETLGRP